MTALVPGPVVAAGVLAPVNATLRAMFGGAAAPGLAPGLLVHDTGQWLPATRLVDGSELCNLLAAAQRRFQAAPHAAATVAWKIYSYWLALPAVLGWAAARRVPLLRPGDVLVRLADHPNPLLVLGLLPSITVAVLRDDPVADHRPRAQVRVVDDEAELLAAFRESLLDAHLGPMLQAVHARTKVGTRTLHGSVSSAIAHGVLRAAHTLPGSPVDDIRTLLAALNVEDLIELVPNGTGLPTVRRKTCCLAFTLPVPKVCAGCCIRPRTGGKPATAGPRDAPDRPDAHEW